MEARRDYKRVSSVAKSPMINYFTDSLKGLPILRNTGENLYAWIKGKFLAQVELITSVAIIDECLINWFDSRLFIYQAILI